MRNRPPVPTPRRIYTLCAARTFNWDPVLSERAGELMRLFGLRLERLKAQRLDHHCRVQLEPGQICYLTGPSGAGKSVLLNAFYEQVPAGERVRLGSIDCTSRQRLIDCMDGSVGEAVAALSRAGLSDVFTMLGRLCELSEGQKWRYRLARALAGGARWVFADEFTAGLDRLSATVISMKLRQRATETGAIFVLAGCHEDVLGALAPDVVVLKYLNGTGHILYRKDGRRQAIAPRIIHQGRYV